ncbi:MraY family glycosyltransferase [Corynebacterium sp. H130]|uniref:MraY family glycosyltransferase n=1 Tax=Corynebacterium sp. H130 TaxID=3133444 RepID=UPI00309EB9C5
MGTGAVGVPLREIALVIVVAAAVTFLTTGIIRHLMVKYGKLSDIRERDVHTVPKPRLGGVAMFSGFLSAVYLAGQLPALTRGFRPVTPEMDAVVWAGFVIVLVGVLDDLFELDAVTKLFGQLAGAVVMSVLGLSWTLLYMPLDGGTVVVLDQIQSTVLTTLFTVMLINAINFVDGLDGLAAGLGMIAALAILAFSLTVLYDQGGTVSAYPPAIIAAALVGICFGFLPHNFEPARIFMGDSGSMLIGLMLAAAATSASGKINMSLYGAADIVAVMSPIIVVVAAVFVPTLDLVLAIVRRVSKGQSPFAADKMHLHHRLLALGHSHRHVVLVLYAWVTVVAFGAVGFTVFPAKIALIGIVVGIILAIGWTLIPLMRKRVR